MIKVSKMINNEQGSLDDHVLPAAQIVPEIVMILTTQYSSGASPESVTVRTTTQCVAEWNDLSETGESVSRHLRATHTAE